MGVPAFYKWLVNKYPRAVVPAVEEKEEVVDATLPNPNGMEFDNLYLDMNGIIHPCFHPDNELFPPTTYEEVFRSIFHYIDQLFQIVRPRKLLYLAIDGVAPRAKMNQQRARRFQTAKNNGFAEAEEDRLRKEFEIQGRQLLPKVESEVADSNIITPGTKFMEELSEALKTYIQMRLGDDPAWRDLQVILSDANVPGEGEHKIMSFIRTQRALPGYNPNTRHCLYGLDADLIMLALATHELHFSILREDIGAVKEQQPECESALVSCILQEEDKSTRSQECFKTFDVKEKPMVKMKHRPYQFLHVWILREYLELDMQIAHAPEDFAWDVERIVDDFIFLCFFVGNDFLPHMPTVQIHEGAVDLLIHVYKTEFKNLGGYLIDMQRVKDSHAGYIKFKRVEKFILSIGTYEDKIFKKRMELQERKLRRILNDLSKSQEDTESWDDADVENEADKIDPSDMLKNTKDLKEKLKNNLRERSDVFKNGRFYKDKVQFGSPGWKQRYYKEKFSAEDSSTLETTRKCIVEKYTEGLCWVLLYYFSGVPSWTWYYPYHYAPFASDLKGLSQVKVKFQKGLPFTPFTQLMSVLPPRSVEALPKAYRALMRDESSDILDFYPQDFEVDMEGKRYMWQGICKLPFIDEERLLNAIKKVEHLIEASEAQRNVVGHDRLYVRSSNKFGAYLLFLFKGQEPLKNTQLTKMEVNSSEEIRGSFYLCDNNLEVLHLAEGQLEVLCFRFELPKASMHIPRLLEGLTYPEKTVYESDIMDIPLWHEFQGGRPSVRGSPRQDRYARTGETQKERSTNFSAGVMHQYAGSSWGSDIGRGKAGSRTACSSGYNGGLGRSSNARWGFGRGGGNAGSHAASSSGYNGGLGLSPNGGWGIGRGRGNTGSPTASSSGYNGGLGMSPNAGQGIGRGRGNTGSPTASSLGYNGGLGMSPNAGWEFGRGRGSSGSPTASFAGYNVGLGTSANVGSVFGNAGSPIASSYSGDLCLTSNAGWGYGIGRGSAGSSSGYNGVLGSSSSIEWSPGRQSSNMTLYSPNVNNSAVKGSWRDVVCTHGGRGMENLRITPDQTNGSYGRGRGRGRSQGDSCPLWNRNSDWEQASFRDVNRGKTPNSRGRAVNRGKTPNSRGYNSRQ